MRIPVVNEQDEIIGYRERYDRGKGDIVRVSALLLKNSKKQVLIAQRSFEKKLNPGLWGPSVVGTVEEGETYDSNIIKETAEEIGLTDIEIKPYKKIFFTLEFEKIFCMVYTGICNKEAEDFILQKEEVNAVKWVSVKELEEWSALEPEAFVGADDHLFRLLKEEEYENQN